MTKKQDILYKEGDLFLVRKKGRLLYSGYEKEVAERACRLVLEKPDAVLRVGVHKNLHRFYRGKGDWSIKVPATKKLLMYRDELELYGCSFKVFESERRRCLAEGQKNVHALAVGTIFLEDSVISSTQEMRQIDYLPQVGHFFFKEDQEQQEIIHVSRLIFEPEKEGWRVWGTSGG